MLTTKTSNDLSNAHLKIIGVFSHTAVWRYSGRCWWRQTVHIAAAKCHGWSDLGAVAVFLSEFYSLGCSRSSR